MEAHLDRLPFISNLWRWKAHFFEIALIIGFYFIYYFTRGIAYADLDAQALRNAWRVIDFEQTLGFFWEPAWQSWAIDHVEFLVVTLNWLYIITYWPIILAMALVVYIVNRRLYHYYRTVILINFTLSLCVFALFPVAPPWQVPEYFVNTIQVYGPSYYGSEAMAVYYNNTAAMPSLHFSWTVIFGVLFISNFRGGLKLIGLFYPALTFMTIVITANHYILDAIAGGVLAALAFAVVEAGRRWWTPLGKWEWRAGSLGPARQVKPDNRRRFRLVKDRNPA